MKVLWGIKRASGMAAVTRLDVPHMRSDGVRAALNRTARARRTGDGASFLAANLRHVDPHGGRAAFMPKNVWLIHDSRVNRLLGDFIQKMVGAGRPCTDDAQCPRTDDNQ